MTQEIKIAVKADPGSADAAIDKIGAAADGTAASINKITTAANVAAAAIAKLDRVGAILSRELGRNINHADAAIFLNNFERMKSSRIAGTQKIRGYDSFENWYRGSATAYKNPSDAARHRRYVMSLGMQNTGFSRSGSPPPPEEPGGGGDGFRPSPFSRGIQRTQSTAMSFGKGMLALAGISGLMSMAGSAVDSAGDEAVTIDTLKRRMGDLGVSFNSLRDTVRSASSGMGITYVEAARLSQEFARVTGRMRGVDVGGDLRTSIGFARSFGIDPGESTQFFGTMRRVGAQGADDQQSKRLALLIGEAISKGGYTAKADEVLRAVSDFASQAARLTLTTPNIGGYAGMLTGLSRTGFPGLDPAGAASMLAAANAAVSRGGGMGEASLNFSYAALARSTPGLNNPLMAQALWQGGMFGTTAQMFGPKSPISQFMGGGGMPGLSDVTNFSKERDLLLKQYGSHSAMALEAAMNQFGLSSMSQAAALMMTKPEDLTGAQRLLGPAGLKMSDLTATGIQGLIGISGAKNFGDLSKIYQEQMGRSDLGADDKLGLTKAFQSGDPGALRNALVRLVATHDQEKTEGSETRASIADVKNAVTKLGTDLLVPLNSIREAITQIAHVFGGELPSERKARMAADAGTSDIDIYGSEENAKAWNWGIRGKPGKFSLSADEQAAIGSAAFGDKSKAQIMAAILGEENRGYGHPNNDAHSGKGALGAYQFMPGTWKDFGEGDFSNARDFAKSSQAASKMIDFIRKKYKTSDPAVVAAYWDGGDPAARAVLAGKSPPSKETQDYLSGFRGLMGATPLPAGDPNGAAERGAAAINIGISGEVNLPVRQGGEDVGTATI